MPDMHDSGYKFLFSNRTIFRQLLETFVDEAWVREADFDQAEPIDKSFISEHYKRTESDLIYKVPLKGSEVYVYILLEFQSTVDRFMAVRVLHYISSLYMELMKAGKRRRLPPVFPIVLYNGDARWTAPTDLNALIDHPNLLGKFGIRFEYFKIAENEFSRESLLRIHNIVSMLFLAESHYDPEMLAGELIALFNHEPDRQAVSLLINWFRQLAVNQRIDENDYNRLHEIHSNQEEVRSMLITALKKEKKEIYEEGLEKGKQEGLEKGKQEERRTIARTMLAHGVSIDHIIEITGLSREALQSLDAPATPDEEE